MSKFKIAIITCWYGEWPWYFKFFLHSVKFNPTVDFIIFTDTLVSDLLPENVKVYKKTLKQIEELASKKLSLNTVIKDPYKLCDYKPAYGLIFEDYLNDYAFWGHGDLDIVFGNIRKFITDDLLSQNDFINTRHDFITGFFALFRNNETMKKLFMLSKDYKKVFTTERHFCFDECNFLQPYLSKGIPLEQLPYEIESMEHVIRKSVKDGLISGHFDFMIVESNPGNLRWENGELIYNEKFESLFYHLIRLKKIPYLVKPFWGKVPDTFYINSFYFSTYSPKSISGLIENLLIGFKSSSYRIKKWVGWYYSLTIKTLSRTNKKESKRQYLGTYRSNNSTLTVGIGIDLNSLFLLDGLQVTQLKHINKNTFLAEKLGCKINFDFSDKACFSMENVFKLGFDTLYYHKL